ncbi:hypothetical protein [Rossellomorea vietnamensis]|uniref:hypothetical protein n=1 Tax=Rossellomorea vietnamensis TaxID=218284 RepID=UPI001E482D50|nr:hypothetical protein [Rossellomorea vietnamensis]MCC5804669.1 hypothetical protein [Rossellomorea vietnamensis]
MSRINKEELLLQSFEVLKKDLEGNSSKIQDIIVKIAKNNLPLAIEMWKYALGNSGSYLKEDGYYYAGGMIYNLEKKIGRERVLNILNDNDDIVEAIFGKVYDVPDTVLWDVLKSGNTELSYKIYSLLKSNRFKENSLASIIDSLCVYFSDEFEDIHDNDDDDYFDEDDVKEASLASDIANIILDWGSEIKDEEVKANITVTLIDYI